MSPPRRLFRFNDNEDNKDPPITELMNKIYDIKEKLSDEEYKNMCNLCKDVRDKLIGDKQLYTFVYISQEHKVCPSNEEVSQYGDDLKYYYQNQIIPSKKTRNVYIRNETNYSTTEILDGFNNGNLVGLVFLHFDYIPPNSNRSLKTLVITPQGSSMYGVSKNGIIGDAVLLFSEIIPIGLHEFNSY